MRRARMSRLLPLLAATSAFLALGPAARGTTPARAATGLPPVKHVFTILLENEQFDTSFGPGSPAPYLSKTLPSLGALLTHYYGIGHESLDNYIAMVSGQAPNPQTQGDCQFFTDFAPGVMGADGQAMGQGCVYPTAVKTLPDQLEAAGLSWKGYMQDMGNTPGQPRTCRHPAINAQDNTQTARADDQYAVRHNPFVYFHSIIDDQARCDARVVPLDELAGDLGAAGTTPSYSFITPDLCSDGHDATCADGSPGGYAGIEGFLQAWVPRILGSPAFADGGLLIVTFDESESESDAEACCGEPTGPNTPQPGIEGPGGGRVGAVLISPFIRPGTVNDTPYNHYSYLRSMEDVFGIATGGADNLGHLGYAGQAGLKAFGSDVFNASPDLVVLPGSGGELGTGGRVVRTASCAPRKLRLVKGSKRVLRRGTVIGSAKVRRPSPRRPGLELRFRRTATLSVSIRSRVTGRVRVVRGKVSPCVTYRVALRTRHGRARVTARVGKRFERRAIRF
jgi:hypothetical protein